MAVITHTLQIETQGNADVVDISRQVTDAVLESGMANGIITVFCPSATSALTTIEYESGVINDLRRLFDEIIDPERHYEHNARWGDGNGHSHVRAAILGPSLTIPFVERKLTLGTWQQIIFIDFDNRARRRSLIAQVLGE
jgi:secondary thiamine-phosphate synthase enzyme